MNRGMMALASGALAMAAPAAAQVGQAQIDQAQINHVRTSGGIVAGEAADGIAIFRGIPFAAPPTGDLRWKAPQPVVPWFGVRPATQFGPACMQEEGMLRQMGSTAPMSEDCLYLDVWTPAADAAERFPVIVWVHGGGYTGGATSVGLYDGEQFARQGVVFVSLAYRLGSFGFLAASDLSAESGQGPNPDSSGNYGMLDMVAGLEWVRDNISQFGGDPDRVTIMGHSAGSSAVSILAASERTLGLIDGVIAESGANFGPVQTTPVAGGGPYALSAAERLGDAWLQGLGASSPDDARALPAARILAAQSGEGVPPWRPVVDGYVLTNDQYVLWRSRAFNDVPLLLGTTSNEWGASGNVSNEGFAERVREQYGAFAPRILAAYESVGEDAAMRLGNEIGMESSAFAWANLHAEHAQSPVWYYWFHNAENGSGHGSEVALVFGNEDTRPGRTAWDDRTRALSRQLQSYWVNFARSGNPNGEGLPRWPQYSPDDPDVLALGLETRVIEVPGKERLEVLADYFDWRRAGSR